MRRLRSGASVRGSKPFDCVCSQTLEGHDGPVKTIALRHDNRKIVSGAMDGKLKVWDLMSGMCTNTLDADEQGRHLRCPEQEWQDRVQRGRRPGRSRSGT